MRVLRKIRGIDLKRVGIPLSLISIVSAYFYFIPQLRIEQATFLREEYVNNYSTKNNSSEKNLLGPSIYLGDHFQFSAEVINPSLRTADDIGIRVISSQALNYLDGELNKLSTSEFSTRLASIGRFGQFTWTHSVSSSIAGDFKIEITLIQLESVPEVQLDKKIFHMRVLPRPVSITPKVPADIIGHLGDRVMRECQEKFPCKTRNAAGSCTHYPDSDGSKQCVIERNSALFSGCEIFAVDGKWNTDWASCLMEKHGFQ